MSRVRRAVSCPPPCALGPSAAGRHRRGPAGVWGLNLETRAGGVKLPSLPERVCSQLTGKLANKRQHPAREGLGSQGDFLMCCPHTGLLQGILPPHPSQSVDLEEQPGGGLRHFTPSCKALSVTIMTAKPQLTTHPNLPCFTNTSSGYYETSMKNRFQLVVVTVPLNASWCPHHTLQASSLLQHPMLAFTKHLFLIKITCQEWCKGEERILHL